MWDFQFVLMEVQIYTFKKFGKYFLPDDAYFFFIKSYLIKYDIVHTHSIGAVLIEKVCKFNDYASYMSQGLFMITYNQS